jgi:SAM-dependent methyltransferase
LKQYVKSALASTMTLSENKHNPVENTEKFSCGVCESNQFSDELRPVEGMLGLKEEFIYRRCSNCGCLQLSNPPSDMAQYYPRNYYAFEADCRFFCDRFPFRRKHLYFPITAARLGWPNVFGKILQKIGSGPFITNSMRMLVRPIKKNSAILDVGCANGRELSAFWSCGFTNLLGIDPYLSEDIHHECGVRILKKELREVSGKFDLIMFHHVLEHLPEQLDALKLAKERLNIGGQILVRIPLSDSKAASDYGDKWVQLDAPRHYFLHTRKSMEIASARAGLKVAKVQYDSEEFQFIGSELYKRTDMSLQEFYADYETNYKRHFQPDDSKKFREMAKLLNQSEQGDQAGFCLIADSSEQ